MGLFARWTAALPTVVWTDSKSTGSASFPTHNFTTVNISDENPTREVFVAASNASVDAVTVNGVLASLVVASAATDVSLWRAAVPTGTSVTISLHYDGVIGSTRSLITVWAAYNLQSTTPHHTQTYASGGASTNHSTTINTAANGILIAALGSVVTAGVTVSSWTGATLSDTEIRNTGATDVILSAADSTNTVAATGATLRATLSGAENATMVAATYR